MVEKRKYLEGELKYVEGKTNVEDILKTLSSELVKAGWVDYDKRGVDYPWTFDKHREIELGDVFKKEHIKLLKIIGMTDIAPSGIPFGEIKAVRGVASNEFKTIILRLNGKDYTIPLELNDTKEQVATKISNFVKVMEGFEDTVVESDGITVTVKGEFAVYELYTNFETKDFISTEVISFSKTKLGFKTGKIEVLGDCQIDGDLIVKINEGLSDEKTISIFLTKDTSKINIVEALKNEIVSTTSYTDTYVVDNVIYVEGELDVITISSSADSTEITNVKSEVRNIENVGVIEVYSTATRTGSIDVTIKRVGAASPQTISVTVSKGDSNNIIATKIRDRLSSFGYACNITSNVVTISSVTELTSNVEVSIEPIAVTISSVLDARGSGVIEFITESEINQNVTIRINNINYTIPILGGLTKEKIAQEVRDYFLNHTSQDFEKTTLQGNIVTIRGKIDILTISSNTDIPDNKPYAISTVKTADKYKGEITVIQSMTVNSNIIVTLNGYNIIIPLLSTDDESSVAMKIKERILDNTDFTETRIDDEDDRTVIIEGGRSVESLSISGVEIPSSNYDVIENVIVGVGDSTSGTNAGDNVLIKTIYTGELFQRLCFDSEMANNGDIKNIAQLKSRPQGDITIYKDTIQVITNDIAQNNGDGITYKLGKFPISKSQNPAHKLKVYKEDNVLIDEKDYVVDYYNGLIIFTGENQSAHTISVTYGVSTGVIGDEVPKADYRIIDNELIDATATGELKDMDIIVMVNYYWDIVYPATVQQIDNTTERMVLKTKIDSTQMRNKTFKKDYYIEFKHIKADRENFLTGLEIRFGTVLDATKTTLDSDNCSEWARVAWYDKKGLRTSGDVLKLEDWLPLTYHISFTQEYANIVLHGSPVVDTTGRDNYLISPIMLGALENYVEVKNEDIQYNFGMSVGSDIFYSEKTMPKKWGDKTGTGITDFVMERTGDGIPYQAHGTSFYTSPEFMDKLFLGASEYTGNQHFSKMTITHEVQRERGMIQSLLVGDRSSIFHLEELITNKEEFNKQGAMINKEGKKFNDCGKANISQEKKWVMFNINSPYWLINNSPNTFYGIALRKS